MGAGSALLLFALGEGIALLIALRANKKLKIASIEETADAKVKTMSDDELKSALNNELNPKS